MENKKRRGDWSSIIRLLKFMWQDYKWVLLVSAVLIVISALVTVNLTISSNLCCRRALVTSSPCVTSCWA